MKQKTIILTQAPFKKKKTKGNKNKIKTNDKKKSNKNQLLIFKIEFFMDSLGIFVKTKVSRICSDFFKWKLKSETRLKANINDIKTSEKNVQFYVYT